MPRAPAPRGRQQRPDRSTRARSTLRHAALASIDYMLGLVGSVGSRSGHLDGSSVTEPGHAAKHVPRSEDVRIRYPLHRKRQPVPVKGRRFVWICCASGCADMKSARGLAFPAVCCLFPSAFVLSVTPLLVEPPPGPVPQGQPRDPRMLGVRPKLPPGPRPDDGRVEVGGKVGVEGIRPRTTAAAEAAASIPMAKTRSSSLVAEERSGTREAG